MSSTDDGYDPYAGLNIDLCLEVDAIDLNNGTQPTNDDYDPYEVFMRMNTRRTINGRDRAPLAVLPSHASTGGSPALVNNYRHYNFADDDTPVKYPLAIGHVDRRLKQPNVKSGQRCKKSKISSNSIFRFVVDTRLDLRSKTNVDLEPVEASVVAVAEWSLDLLFPLNRIVNHRRSFLAVVAIRRCSPVPVATTIIRFVEIFPHRLVCTLVRNILRARRLNV